MTTLFNRTPKHIVVSREDHVEIFTLPIAGLSGKFIFDEFSSEAYMHILAQILGMEVSEIYDGKSYRTLLQNTDGTPYTMPIGLDGQPEA